MIDVLRTHGPTFLLSLLAVVAMYLHVKDTDERMEADARTLRPTPQPLELTNVRTVQPPPRRQALLTAEIQRFYREEVETRRATREGNRGALRPPKGSGPRVDATKVTPTRKLIQ